MPKKIVQKAVGELIETGKATARAGKKAAGDVVKQVAKTVVGVKTEDVVESMYEKSDGVEKKLKKEVGGKMSEEQVKKLGAVDRTKSTQRYKEIQEKIRLEQRKKGQSLRKYETGKEKFDEEQVKDPETFFEKLKKKQEEAKKKKDVSGLKRNLGGTGELRRGMAG